MPDVGKLDELTTATQRAAALADALLMLTEGGQIGDMEPQTLSGLVAVLSEACATADSTARSMATERARD